MCCDGADEGVAFKIASYVLEVGGYGGGACAVETEACLGGDAELFASVVVEHLVEGDYGGLP